MLRLARRRFGSLVSAPLARSLARMNVHAPNAMQQKALPIALAGDDDLLVCSQTGSGKTLIFLLPMLEALASRSSHAGSAGGGAGVARPEALVVVPSKSWSANH